MKKILYFFPDDITRPDAGNKTRAINLLHYFKERGFKVDFVSLVQNNGEPERYVQLQKDRLFKNFHLLERKPKGKGSLFYFLQYKLWDLFYYWFTYPSRSKIPTYLTLKLKMGFSELLKADKYDHVIISYAHSADLISDKALLKNAHTILDTHDFLTAQFKDKPGFQLGITFQDEINRLDKFDEVWAISPEEQYIFAQFSKADVKLVPMMLDGPATSGAAKKYDLVYVGNDNVHNVSSVKWFFDKVYPQLPADVNICMAGKVVNYVPDLQNVTKIAFAQDLGELYNASKIALCPMLQGTGIKVKVVEALAHALPVVCTTRGVDGLPKHHNGCLVSDDADKFAANITSLLTNGTLYAEQSRLAEATFKHTFDKKVVFKLLDEAFGLAQ
ncbi:glycosyltransferase [Mucilaginibacter conchicola]|uniref:Glycosyltransferase n=1 Tax=Mucilaginibacter conchicola TaxID=2303333 RepID=A0A372NU67_9SPHI|nr:glycosyltransferase [Mucilaginibacter conchicola]RFZ92147.1 glycosyltransferase [Mucilaginibacter conchicola]